MVLRKHIVDMAFEVKKEFGTSDPFKICRQLDINVLYHELGNNILGYFVVVFRIPTIVINSELSDVQSNFVCAHELGHYFCKHRYNTEALLKKNMRYFKDGNEAEANIFMANFLMNKFDACDGYTSYELLKINSLPEWVEPYVEWDRFIQK